MSGKHKEQLKLPGFPDDPPFDIASWWADTAAQDAAAFAPKFQEYGSEDLAEIGRQMLAVAGRTGRSVQEETEAGLYFYLLGKMARWTEAMKQDRPVSDDTLLDLTTYATMARLNRAGGMA